MTMTRDELVTKLKDVLSKQLSVEIDKITEDSLIADDLGADSLDTAEIAMEIKEVFGHDLTDEEMTQVKSVKNITDILFKATSSKSEASS